MSSNLYPEILLNVVSAGWSTTKVLFLVLSFVAICSTLLVVFNRNPVHNVLYLIIAFFAIAGHYVLLNAQFLAAVHVIVYAGAIMVLFLYVIMMLNLNRDTEPQRPVWTKIAAVVAGGIFMVTLVGALRGATMMEKADGPREFVSGIGLTENLGKVLFDQFLVPFELSSVLFLAAMVGAVMLGKKSAK